MILFNEQSVDEQELYRRACEAFYKAASNMHSDDFDAYKDTFSEYDISDLKTALARISYSKNFEIEGLFYFDQSTSFHFYLMLYVYAKRHSLGQFLKEECTWEAGSLTRWQL